MKNKPLKQHISENKTKAFVFFVLVMMLLSMIPLHLKADDSEVTLEDYNGRRIGVLVGPLTEDIANKFFPDSEHLLLNSYTDCVTALLTNKIDGYLADEPNLKVLMLEQPEISYIPERMMVNNYSFAFRKNDPKAKALCDELNEFIKLCWADGTMDEIESIWFGSDEERKIVDMSDLKKDGRIIKVVTTATDMPFSYIKDNKNVGYDIDLIVRFCRAKGYGLELTDVDFAGRIPEIESGKCDFTTAMNVTPERKEQVLFSEPTGFGGIVLAVRAADLKTKENSNTYSELDELNGKRIGVTSGSIHDKLIEKRIAQANIMYFPSLADLSAALKAGQIDAFACPSSTATFMRYEDESLKIMDEHLLDGNLAYAFPKSDEGKRLNERISDYIRKIKKDGSLEKLRDKWFAADESGKTLVEYEELPDTNGTIRAASSAQQIPYCYVRGNDVVGLEIEILADFCAENGYRLEVEKMNLEGVLASVQSGKFDLAASCLAVTEERKESMYFSEFHSEQSVVLVVLDEEAGEHSTGFFDSIYNSFYKTFIREDRYKLFLQGIEITMLITVLTIIFGTALGFIVFMLCRNGNVLANKVTSFCVWLVSGMPMVVLLMVLYYIVFSHVAINGIAVAVIGFTLTFGASVYGLIKMAVGTIDRGQYEAAYALGHSNRQTFYRVILPQAIPHILPAYQGEIVSLIKATAIVGYIAVQDLTKMGDIVRSRTYEAFFPLIAVTIIYFVLEGFLGFAVSRIRINIDPKKRKTMDLLKGVNIHD